MNLYQDLIAAGCEIDHHESDLLVKLTEASAAVLNRYPDLLLIMKIFRSKPDQAQWADIPFAYTPYWEARQTGEGRQTYNKRNSRK